MQGNDDRSGETIDPEWFAAEIDRHRLSLTGEDRAALREALPKLERLAARLRRPLPGATR